MLVSYRVIQNSILFLNNLFKYVNKHNNYGILILYLEVIFFALEDKYYVFIVR